MSWGISPQAMIGHSIGEYVAACLANVFSLADALKLVTMRGRLMQQQLPGAMIAVSLPATEVEARLGPSLSLAASNAPALCVVSGAESTLAEWQSQLVAEGIGCRSLHTSHAFHSQMMVPAMEPFREGLASVALHPPDIAWISNVTGTWITTAEATDPDYWVRHLRQTVRFAEGVTELLQTPHQIFLEVGPGSTLSSLARKQTTQLQVDQQHLVWSSLPHPKDPQPELAHLCITLGRLWSADVAIYWSEFYAHEQRCRLPLPTYPFERQRYWIEPSADWIWSESEAAPGETTADSGQDLVSEPDVSPAWQPLTSDVEVKQPQHDGYEAPRNEVEAKIAQLWCDILGVEKVGVFDNFFELGGDSVLGIQIIALAGQQGLRFTPTQLFAHQTIAELAAIVTAQPETEAEQGLVTGQIPLTPTQYRFFAQDLSHPERWNQAILLEIHQPLDINCLEQTVQHWLTHHDALRLRFVRHESGWQQFSTELDARIPFRVLDFAALSSDQQAAAMDQAVLELRTSLNLSQGPLLQVAYFNLGPEQSNRLLLVVHDLVIDAHSWGVLLEDFPIIYQQLSRGSHVQLLPKTTAFKQWTDYVHHYAQTANLTPERTYWIEMLQKPLTRLPIDYPNGRNIEGSTDIVSTHLDAEVTQVLWQDVLPAYGVGLNHGVLMALVQTVATWAGGRSLLIDIEHPGRFPIPNMDLSRTVGCFSHHFPAWFTLPSGEPTEAMLKAIKQQLNSIPQDGSGYAVWRYLSDDPVLVSSRFLPREFNFVYMDESVPAQVTENTPPPPAWLGQLQTLAYSSSRTPQMIRPYLLEVRGKINTAQQLRLDWSYSQNLYHPDTIQTLAQQTLATLQALITEAQSQPTFGYTPSDFTATNISPKDLNQLLIQFSQS